MSARLGAVIVNYNCAPLALDAALSVLGAMAATGGTAMAVIVDNASSDNSADFFRAVARGAAHQPLAPAAGGVRFDAAARIAFNPDRIAPGVSILSAPGNGGFAAGCNIGLRALPRDQLDMVLLLNPDAVIAERGPDAFARRLADPAIGLCGASVLAFDPPHAAQALGGARLDPLTLLGANLGAGLALADAPPTEDIEASLDYPLGAAIACRPDYIDKAGFLDESYFLYYEEADWTFAGRNFARVGWARDAIVYHRYGASSKSERPHVAQASNRSPLSDYHMARSRLLFALKWRPALAPAMMALGGLQAARRLARGKPALARAVALGSLPGAARAFG